MAQRKLRGDAYVLTFDRRKGGIGTTTSMIALGTGLAAKGYSVLMLEGDDNRRLSRILLGLDRKGGPAVQDTQTTYHLFTHPDEGIGNSQFELDTAALLNEMPGDQAAIRARRGWMNPAPLRIVPGSRSLRRLESDFIINARSHAQADFQPYTQLMKAIAVFRRDFDFILIDPPSMLGLIAMNEVMAAQYVMFLLDFDPDSRYDLEEANDFYRLVVSNCTYVRAPVPELLGVVLNKYTGSTEDHTLLQAYIGPHYDDDLGREVPALLQYPTLACLPFEDSVMKKAMRLRRPVHVTAPLSRLGETMYGLCTVIEQRLGLIGAPAQPWIPGIPVMGANMAGAAS